MARVGHDAKIFKTLAEADAELSLEELAAKTSVDPVLLSRSSEMLFRPRSTADFLQSDCFVTTNQCGWSLKYLKAYSRQTT